MFRYAVKIVIVAGLLSSLNASGQNSCGNTKLSCLIPTALHVPASEIRFFNEALGTQISQLPLATPASGFIFVLDKSLGVYVASSESFGPVLTERTETIGRHRAYFAFTYQRFSFSEIDGNDLDHLPIVLTLSSGQVVTQTVSRLDTKVDQYAAFATYGLANRIDVSVALPFERVSMGMSTSGTEFSSTTPATASFTEFVAGSASGVSDLLVSAKGTLIKSETFGLALGADIRFPSGDEHNFLGSGAYGIKPYLAVSKRGRVSPHFNLGYQWNFKSVLAANDTESKYLPAFFSYASGADIGITRRMTVIADLLGEHFFNAPQVTTTRDKPFTVNNGSIVFPAILPTSGSYTMNSLGLGIKANPIKHLLVTANATIKLDNGGLRAKVIPLIGVSYSF